jgi:hypothetical protein
MKSSEMAPTESINARIDRNFYAFMAMLFAATAIAGFTPNSIAILSATKTNPPLLIHFHAAAMSSWLLLLAAQATLVASNKTHIHKRLGMVSVVLAPIIVMLMLAIKIPLFLDGDFATTTGGVIQIKRISLFSIFYVWAFLSRRTDSAAHKRLMFLATLVVIDAAFNRLLWLPTFGFENFRAVRNAYQLLLLAPLLVYDILKLGRIHRVNIIGSCLVIAFMIVARAL